MGHQERKNERPMRNGVDASVLEENLGVLCGGIRVPSHNYVRLTTKCTDNKLLVNVWWWWEKQ